MTTKQRLKEALKHLAAGRHRECSDVCVQTLKSKEGRDNYDALVYLGKASFLLGERDKAIKAYERATQVKPEACLQAWKGVVEVAGADRESEKKSGEEQDQQQQQLVTRAYEALLDATDVTTDPCKWYETCKALCSHLDANEKDAKRASELRQLCLQNRSRLPDDLHTQALRDYCDHEQGEEEEDVLKELYERTSESKLDSPYHMRYMETLVLLKRKTSLVLEVCDTLISSYCTLCSLTALETAMQVLDEDQDEREDQDSQQQLPPRPTMNCYPLPVHGRYRKYVLQLVHRYPWASEAWPQLTRLALNKREHQLPLVFLRKMRSLIQSQVKEDPRDLRKQSWMLWMLLAQLLSVSSHGGKNAPLLDKAIKCLEKSSTLLSAAKHTNCKWIPCLQKLCLGMLLSGSGRLKRAEAMLKDVCRQSDVKRYTLLAEEELGHVLMKTKQNWEQAEKHIHNVLQTFPKSHRTLSDLGWIYYKRSKCCASHIGEDSSVTLLQKSLESLLEANHLMMKRNDDTSSGTAIYQYRLACVYWSHPDSKYREDRKFAYSHFLQAASKTNQHSHASIMTQSKAFRRLGDFYLLVGQDRGRALKCYTKALDLDPGRETAGRKYCKLMVTMTTEGAPGKVGKGKDNGKLLTMIETCQRCLERLPSIRWALRPLALALVDMQEYEQALPIFQKAIRVHKGKGTDSLGKDDVLGHEQQQQRHHQSLWEGLALCYEHTKRYQSALKAYSFVRESYPETCLFSLIRLGKIHSDIFLNHESALEVFAEAKAIAEKATNDSQQQAFAQAAITLGTCSSLLNLSRKYTKMGAQGTAGQCLDEAFAGLGLAETTGLSCTQTYWKLFGDLKLEQLKMLPYQSCINGERGLGTQKTDLAKAARRAYLKVLHQAPYTSKCWHDVALTAHLEGCGSSAKISILRGLAVNADDPALWASLGIVEASSKVKEYSLARSLQLEPTNADTWVCLAALYLRGSEQQQQQQRLMDMTAECLQTARIYQPSCPSAWECEATLRCKRERVHFNGAETYAYAMRLSNTSYAKKHYALETLIQNENREREGDMKRARIALQSSMQSGDVTDAVCHLCNGLILEYFGEYQDAEASHKKALLVISEDNAKNNLKETVHVNLARVLVKASKYREALDLYEGSLDIQNKLAYLELSHLDMLSYACAKLKLGTHLDHFSFELDSNDYEWLGHYKKKAALLQVLQTSGMDAGVQYVAQMEYESSSKNLTMDCWLMILTFAVKASHQEGGDLQMNFVLSRMKASALWQEMKEESLKLMALGYLLLGKTELASRSFARVVHSNPLDLLSHVSLLYWSSKGRGERPEKSFESLLCCVQNAPDLLRNAFRFFLKPRSKPSPKDEAKRRRVVISKCIHSHPEFPELWTTMSSCVL